MINNDAQPDMVNVIATSEEQDVRVLGDNSDFMNKDNRRLQQEMEINADLAQFIKIILNMRLWPIMLLLSQVGIKIV